MAPLESGEDLVEEAETYGLAETPSRNTPRRRWPRKNRKMKPRPSWGECRAALPEGEGGRPRRGGKRSSRSSREGWPDVWPPTTAMAFFFGPQFPLPKYSFLPYIDQWTAAPAKTDGTGEKSVKPKSANGKAAPKVSEGRRAFEGAAKSVARASTGGRPGVDSGAGRRAAAQQDRPRPQLRNRSRPTRRRPTSAARGRRGETGAEAA